VALGLKHGSLHLELVQHFEEALARRPSSCLRTAMPCIGVGNSSLCRRAGKAIIDAFSKEGAMSSSPSSTSKSPRPTIHGRPHQRLSGKRGHVTAPTPRAASSPPSRTGAAIGIVRLPNAAEVRHRRAGIVFLDFSHYAPVPRTRRRSVVSKHKQPVEEGEQER